MNTRWLVKSHEMDQWCLVPSKCHPVPNLVIFFGASQSSLHINYFVFLNLSPTSDPCLSKLRDFDLAGMMIWVEDSTSRPWPRGHCNSIVRRLKRLHLAPVLYTKVKNFIPTTQLRFNWTWLLCKIFPNRVSHCWSGTLYLCNFRLHRLFLIIVTVQVV